MAHLPLTDNRLTIADLARELSRPPYNMGRSAIQRFDENADVRQILGKQDDLYPAESLDWWRRIAAGRSEKPPLVSPATAGRFLSGVMENPLTLPVLPTQSISEGTTDNPSQRRPVQNQNFAETDARSSVALPEPGREALAAFMSDAVQRGIENGMRQIAGAGFLPVGSDRLLSMREAREQTGMSESTIRTLPCVQERDGGRRKWKMSVLQSRLASL